MKFVVLRSFEYRRNRFWFLIFKCCCMWKRDDKNSIIFIKGVDRNDG